MREISYQDLVEQSWDALSQELLGYGSETGEIEVSGVTYLLKADEEGCLLTVSRQIAGESPSLVLSRTPQEQLHGWVKTDALLQLHQGLRERNGLSPELLHVIPTPVSLAPEEVIERTWAAGQLVWEHATRNTAVPLQETQISIDGRQYRLRAEVHGQRLLDISRIMGEKDFVLVQEGNFCNVGDVSQILVQAIASAQELIEVCQDLQQSIGEAEAITLCSADNPFLLKTWAAFNQYLRSSSTQDWVDAGAIPEVDIFGWTYQLHREKVIPGFALESVRQPGQKIATYDLETGEYHRFPDGDRVMLWAEEGNRIESSLLPEEYEAFWLEVESGLGEYLNCQYQYVQPLDGGEEIEPVVRAEPDHSLPPVGLFQALPGIGALENLLTASNEMSRVQGLERLFHLGEEGIREVIRMLESDPSTLVQKTAIEGLIQFNEFQGMVTNRDEQIELALFILQEEQLRKVLDLHSPITPDLRYEILRSILLERNPALEASEDSLLERLAQWVIQKTDDPLRAKQVLLSLKISQITDKASETIVKVAQYLNVQEATLSRSARELAVALGEQVQPGIWRMNGEQYEITLKISYQAEFVQIREVSTGEVKFKSREGLTQICTLSAEEQAYLNRIAQDIRETVLNKDFCSIES